MTSPNLRKLSVTLFEEWWMNHSKVVGKGNPFEAAKESFQAGWDQAMLNAANIIMKVIPNDD